MDQNDTHGLTQEALRYQNEAATALAALDTSATTVAAQGSCGCAPKQAGSRNTLASFVYVMGKVTPRFPNLSVEKECFQTPRNSQSAGIINNQALYAMLQKPENRYLARQLCWVLTVEGLETYILQPRDPADLSILIDTLRPLPRATDLSSAMIDVVIGIKGPLAPPEMCNSLMIPIVVFDQLYSFDMEAFMGTLPKPDKMADNDFTNLKRAATKLFQQIKQMADNTGATDEYRALNYLTVRDPLIYLKAWEMEKENCLLTDVQVRPSRLSGARNVVDAIFVYTSQQVGITQKFFIRIDVTEEFPFLVSKLAPYYVYDQYP
ncbi:MAG: hypothetical protein NPIRA01_16650 [Nitrospirales bacterium]|nr:MAG: hypothetical protein NPIRA01_16650 [Nitrospirales bacterium]